MKKSLIFAVLAAGLFTTAGAAENILAGKSVIFEDKPDYHLTKNDTDAKDLTDGKTQNWLIWNYKTSVGWERGKSYSFYFDLGKEMPIGKIRLHTSAGQNGVKLPKAIHIYAGNSLTEFAQIGEMIKQNPQLNPEAQGAPTTFWIEGKNRSVSARYLKFVVTPSDTKEAYFFTDEITAEPGINAVPVSKLPVSKGIKAAKISGPNILAGKTAIYEQAPNYNLTLDANDPKDLTDGYTNTWQIHFYKSSVGWEMHQHIAILFDLGQETEIGEIKIHTSQGHGSVNLPEELLVMAGNSTDEFAILDDMIASNPDLPKYEDGPKVFWVTAKNKPVKARYLKFIASPEKDSTFFFLDEVYVGAGENGVSVDELPKFKGSTHDFIKYSRLQTRLKQDTEQIRENIRLANSKRSVEDLFKKLQNDPESTKMFSKVYTDFPMNNAQIELAKFRQQVLADAGYKGLVLWGANRWDLFHSFTFPEKKAAGNVLKMTPGETRSFIINMANADAEKMAVDFTVEAPFPVEVNKTVTAVDTNNFLNANRLQPLNADGKKYQVELLPGESGQIFFRIVLPRDLTAGSYPVNVKFANGKTITTTVKANSLKFPAELTAEYGTWDYLNALGCHGNQIDKDNFDRAIELMRAYQMDLAWGHENALPFARPEMFDAEGNLIQSLDFSKLDEWLNLMKGFKRYAIFGGGGLNQRLNFGHLPEKEPELFKKHLVSYLNALAAHIENVHNLPVDRFRLHFIDEASTPEQKALLTTWCSGVKEAKSPSGKKFYSYGNPFFNVKEEVYSYPELDIIQPNPGEYTKGEFELFVQADKKRNGKGFTALYICKNRVRMRDAYIYFGLISRLGILFDNFLGIGFWNIACAPNGINELDYTGRIFTPWYFFGNDIYVSRQAEAILEGREDYEYMLLLKNLIPELKKAKSPYANDAEKLLASIKKEVFAELGGPNNELSMWRVKKDRSVADRQRDKIWDLLEKVSRSNPAVMNQTIWK